MSTVSKFSEDIFRLKPRDGQFSPEALTLLMLRELSRTPTMKDEEDASRYSKQIYNSILKRQSECVAKGGLPTFTPETGGRLRWVAPSDGDRAYWQKLRFRALTAMWLDGLDDREYEFASGVLMTCLGANKVEVTRQRNEFGIDFIAIVPAYSKNTLFVSGARGLRIVGQTKKYSSAVPREKIQIFNDTLNSVRGNRAELSSVLPPWFFGSSAPILSCFVAHSGFQSGSVVMSSQQGHLLLDTLEIAEIIALSTYKFYQMSDGDYISMLQALLKKYVLSR